MTSKIPTLSTNHAAPNVVDESVSEPQPRQVFRVGGWWYGVHHHGF